MSCGQGSNQDPRDSESNAQPFDLLQTSTHTYEQICDHIVHVCGDNIICQMHLGRALVRFSRTKISNIVQIGRIDQCYTVLISQ